MRKKGTTAFLLLLLIAGLEAPPAHAQLESLLERYTGENAAGFIRPLVTGFGADLNSGLYQSAYVPKGGLHLNIRINGMLALFSSDQKTFLASTQGYFYPPEGEVKTATVVGGRGTTVTGTGGTKFRFPDGYDLKSLLIGAPTITIGSIAGTEASLRYMSYKTGADIGVISLFGIGARHSISQYIPLSPVDIAAGVFYHHFRVGDIIKNNVYSVHAEAGKSFTFLDVYGGIAWESNKASIRYTADIFGHTEKISINVTGKNRFRGTFGLGFNLLVVHLNLDYSVGRQRVLNAGLSVGL